MWRMCRCVREGERGGKSEKKRKKCILVRGFLELQTEGREELTMVGEEVLMDCI
jgi:hypothetical protein